MQVASEKMGYRKQLKYNFRNVIVVNEINPYDAASLGSTEFFSVPHNISYEILETERGQIDFAILKSDRLRATILSSSQISSRVIPRFITSKE